MNKYHRFFIHVGWLTSLVVAGGLIAGSTWDDQMTEPSSPPLSIAPSNIAYDLQIDSTNSLQNQKQVSTTPFKPSQEIYLDNGWTGWKIESKIDTDDEVQNILYRTEDAGATWIKLGDSGTKTFPSGIVGAIRLVNEQQGWIAIDNDQPGEPNIYSTQDGGVSWSVAEMKIPADFRQARFEPKTPILFDGTQLGIYIAQTGYAADRHDVNPLLFYVTADGGKTWSDPLQSENGEWNGLVWKTKRMADGVGRNWSITIDGRTWTFERNGSVNKE
ncbi:hypothetical protein [Saccharibacillus sp. JS10]|uniref:WD40/YVTN/BNR-like repeat-containing protein n=1 Tax=Saccharibacillus sp. JS10 TaxID=2950552 RepID=UPI00210C7EB6|nr:hypothetical protein [Saccharibacillus sp. JS10]MCQ4086414.1 hypothetical protein [Saccharibacillus sp. JS10]